MTTDLERDLREHFAAIAQHAPDSTLVSNRVRRQIRRTRRARAGAAILVAVGVAVGGWSITSARDDAVIPPLPDTGSELQSQTQASCAFDDDGASVAAESEFAFAGTVSAIDKHGTGQAAVIFAVEEWFRGDGAATTTVNMQGPLPEGVWQEDTLPPYAVGTRLLVSGVEGSAWACGFTRPYAATAAREWRRAFAVTDGRSHPDRAAQ